jgi:hypothetical protein
MANNEQYEKFIQAYNFSEAGNKIDPMIINRFERLVSIGKNVDEIALPMLIQIAEDSSEDLSQYVLVGSKLGNIYSARANPEQLHNLLDLEWVERLENSGSGFQEMGPQVEDTSELETYRDSQ